MTFGIEYFSLSNSLITDQTRANRSSGMLLMNEEVILRLTLADISQIAYTFPI